MVTPSSELVWIGEFTARKRPLDAVGLAGQLMSKRVPFHMNMLGNGPLRSAVSTRIDALGLREHVTLRGHVAPQSFIRDSSALVHTATWEGLPRVGLEAIAMGRPVVGYRIKGLTSLPGAVLATDGDVKELASLASKVLANPASFVPRVNREELSWKYSATLIEEFLARVLRENSYD
ncbi:glycosyltransferase [Dietzia kunjamensis]|nr:glycosyltransferase [Dietzia kunjamensis]USX45192.1 glycosyltransferase [Dietzia kunjamensis]